MRESKSKKVYLAGQWNEYESNWKESFKELKSFEFFDPEIHSDQSSPETYFPDDLKAIEKSDIMIANPGLASSEGTWIEIGYFLANNTDKPGDICKNLIIIWKNERTPKWSLGFVKKAGVVAGNAEEAISYLKKL